MLVAKEQIRQIITDNNISSVADVYTLLRDGFKDILQELMEAELDATSSQLSLERTFEFQIKQMIKVSPNSIKILTKLFH